MNNFEPRLALAKRRIEIARENYRECNRRIDSIIERMRVPLPDQRSIDYLSGLADAALERLREAFDEWNKELDVFHNLRVTDGDQRGYREEGDCWVWEPQDWTDLEPLEVAPAPGAMQRSELDDFDYSDIEEF